MNNITPLIWEQLWRQVEKKDDESCWPWLGVIGHDGYGKMTHDGKYFAAHMVAWSSAHEGRGPVTRLKNTCGMRSCCNPGHWLERTIAAGGLPGGLPAEAARTGLPIGGVKVLVELPQQAINLFQRQAAVRGWSRARMVRFALEYFCEQPMPMIDKSTTCAKCRDGNHCGGGVLMEDGEVRWTCACPKCAPEVQS